MRQIRDAALQVALNIPAQNTAANSAPIDFEAVAPGATLEMIEVEVALPDLPNLSDGQTITIHLEDSADGSSFTDIATLSSVVVTGAGGAGASATARTFKLPSATRRYVRMNVSAGATAGDNTEAQVTLDPLF